LGIALILAREKHDEYFSARILFRELLCQQESTPAQLLVFRPIRDWRRFPRKGVGNGFAHDQLDLFAKTRHQGICVLQDQLLNGFVQTPLKHQVHPLHHTLHQRILRLD